MRHFIKQPAPHNHPDTSRLNQCLLARVPLGIRERMRGLGTIVMSLNLAATSCIPIIPSQSLASTITAASCSRNDVEVAAKKAANGDTVLIPAGSCTWTSNLTIDKKFLTLQGAGTGRTIITDGVGKGTFPNIPQVLAWNTIDGGLSRLTGITFKGGIIPDLYNKGIVQLTGSSHSFRIDHCDFIPTQTAGLFIRGDMRGVIDHNVFDLSARKGYGMYILGTSYGDTEWAENSTLGTERNVFVEDNLFTNDLSHGSLYPAIDGWSGSRVVIRHNRFDGTFIANHGTESGGRWRSQRSFEIYENTITGNLLSKSFPTLVDIRGGNGVIYNNTAIFSNGSVKHFATYSYFRASKSYLPWGQCPSSWDQSGDRCIDQTGVGRGIRLSGDSPSAEWLNQVSEPTYDWENKINGVDSPAVSNAPTVIREKQDYFHTPKPGYTPYPYPHPLTTLSATLGPSPDSPQNLAIK